MDKYDPKCHVGLLVDEWGTWWDQEPGSIPGHLYQQNTMRDAMVAALSLNVFHKFTRRVKMANIAQIANVLQSMWLTKGDQMVLTPTYYVFKMYVPHMEATYVPVEVTTGYRHVDGDRMVPDVSATASLKDGVYTISLTNVDLEKEATVEIPVQNIGAKVVVGGDILTCANINDYNDFGQQEKVSLKKFANAKINKGILTVNMPAKSIITIQVK